MKDYLDNTEVPRLVLIEGKNIYEFWYENSQYQIYKDYIRYDGLAPFFQLSQRGIFELPLLDGTGVKLRVIDGYQCSPNEFWAILKPIDETIDLIDLFKKGKVKCQID